MRRLPPLGAIEAFVQVARLGSVKAAAVELSLSAPALSRRVQARERFIGKPLFDRRHQAMALTADGERLLGHLAPVMDQLSDAVEAMTSGAEVLRLRLGVLPLYASQRLFPHLGELRRAHPELHLDIDTAGHGTARLGAGLDAFDVAAHRREHVALVDVAVVGPVRLAVVGGQAVVELDRPLAEPGDRTRATYPELGLMIELRRIEALGDALVPSWLGEVLAAGTEPA